MDKSLYEYGLTSRHNDPLRTIVTSSSRIEPSQLGQ